MFCMYCGAQLQDGSKFCFRCGKKTDLQAEKRVEATKSEAVHNVNNRDEQTVVVRNSQSSPKNGNAYPPTERWDKTPSLMPETSIDPVRNNETNRRIEPELNSPQNNGMKRQNGPEISSPQKNGINRHTELKYSSPKNNETDNKTEQNRVPSVIMAPNRSTDAPGNGSPNVRPTGDQVLTYNQTYKYASIGLLATALLITLTQAWYSISAGVSSLLGFGGYFNIESYLPQNVQGIITSMQNGKLGLIDSYRILNAIYEIEAAFSDASESQSLVIFYLCLVTIVIGFAGFELLLKVLDKDFNYVAFSIYLVCILLTYYFVYDLNDSIGHKVIGISIWPIISAVMALASSIVWKYYRNSATTSSDAVKQYSWNSTETRDRASQVINKSRETAEVIWQGTWGDYVRHHKAAVILAASSYVGFAVLLRMTSPYGDFRIMLMYCYTFFTAISLGLAAVYAEHKEYRFLTILGVLCFTGDLIYHLQDLSYASFGYLLYLLFSNVFAVGAIYLIGRYVQSNTLILMTAGGAIVNLILMPIIGFGNVYFNSYKMISLIGIIGIVLFYMFGNEAFCSIFGLPEWRFVGAPVNQKIKCPVCGNEVEAGSAFCSRCGSKLS